MEEKSQATQATVSVETPKAEDKKCCGMCKGTCKKFFTVKFAIIIAVVLVIVGLAFYFFKPIAATVNGHPISRFAVISELEKTNGKVALANLISKRLIEDEISSKGIKVTDEEVNAEVKKVEDQIKGQGSTLEQELTKYGMTMGDLKEQTVITKSLEKLLADKIQVTDPEVNAYVKSVGEALPKGKEAETLAYLKEQMKRQKFEKASSALVSELTAKSKVSYFVNAYRP
jgi:hypothetical protein